MPLNVNRAQVWKCEHCNSTLADERGLRQHKIAQRKCRAAEKRKNQRETPIRAVENQSIVEICEEHDVEMTPEQTTVETLTVPDAEMSKNYNCPLEFIKLVRSFGGGAGLSQKNMTQLLGFMKNPNFKPTELPFSSGKAANVWFRKYIVENGFSQVW